MCNLHVWNGVLHSNHLDHNRTSNSTMNIKWNSQQTKLVFLEVHQVEHSFMLHYIQILYMLHATNDRIITSTGNTSIQYQVFPIKTPYHELHSRKYNDEADHQRMLFLNNDACVKRSCTYCIDVFLIQMHHWMFQTRMFTDYL